MSLRRDSATAGAGTALVNLNNLKMDGSIDPLIHNSVLWMFRSVKLM